MVMRLLEEWKRERLEIDTKRSIHAQMLCEEFRRLFPIESILDMQLEDYIFVSQENRRKDTFCVWLYVNLEILSKLRPSSVEIFGIYETGGKIKVANRYNYLKDYGDDYQAAFEYIKKEIYTLLTSFRDGDYNALQKCSLNKAFANKLLITYFNDQLIPVTSFDRLTEYCEIINCPISKNEKQIERNLSLQSFIKSNDNSVDWNTFLMMSYVNHLHNKYENGIIPLRTNDNQ